MTLRPDTISYFEHEQDLGEQVWTGLPKAGFTTCHHFLSWSWLFGIVLDCHDEAEQSITRRVGIELEQRTDFEATVKASVGSEFIGKAETEIKGAFGESLTLSRSLESTQTFHFKGKDCFRTSINLYQLQSRLELACEWKPLIGKRKYWNKTLRINHERFAHIKKPEKAHAACGCDDPNADQVDQFGIQTAVLQLVEPFVLRNRNLAAFTVGLAVDEGKVETFDADEPPRIWPPRDLSRDWSIDPREAFDEQTNAVEALVALPGKALPSYLRFLIGTDATSTLTTAFSIPQEAELA
jgi:hypothetical protein